MSTQELNIEEGTPLSITEIETMLGDVCKKVKNISMTKFM